MTLTFRNLLPAILLGSALLAAPALAQAPQAAAPRAAPAPVRLSADDQAVVDRAVAYLEGLSAASGRFVQTDPRGSVTQGQILLQRPGKARFEYDAPSGLLVVSDGAAVNVLDRRLKTFESYPLSSTPLGLFLAGRIKLDGGVRVTRVTRLADGFALTAEDPRRQTRGSITLNFTDGPLSLAGWTVIDARGAQTRVRLVDFGPTSGLQQAQFVLRNPRPPAARTR
jgi:outer membrane lipoprotein-sorting protein